MTENMNANAVSTIDVDGFLLAGRWVWNGRKNLTQFVPAPESIEPFRHRAERLKRLAERAEADHAALLSASSKKLRGMRPSAPVLRAILAKVEGKTGVHPRDIMGTSRPAKIAHARHEVFLALHDMGYSFPGIACVFPGRGGRKSLDHTSVLNGVRRAKAREAARAAEGLDAR